MTHPPRKRRTVLWLFTEDYEFLERIADADGETKGASMHRLVRALRLHRVTTFRALETLLAAAQDKDAASPTYPASGRVKPKPGSTVDKAA